MAQINIRIDDKIEREAEGLFDSLGLTMSSAIMVFIRKSLAEHGIPFAVCAKNSAYHEKLMQAKHDWEDGRKNYHYHDLIEVDDDNDKPKNKSRRTANRRRRVVA